MIGGLTASPSSRTLGSSQTQAIAGSLGVCVQIGVTAMISSQAAYFLIDKYFFLNHKTHGLTLLSIKPPPNKNQANRKREIAFWRTLKNKAKNGNRDRHGTDCRGKGDRAPGGQLSRE